MPKLLQALMGSGEGRGSRRLQLTAAALTIILSRPELALPVVVLAVAAVASLTLTDLHDSS